MEQEKITSSTMTKKDLVNIVSNKLGFTQTDIAKTIECVLETIVEKLAEGKRWEIRNFGVFEVKKRAPRKGRNPKTKEEVAVPERYVVTFKPGKELKQFMDEYSKQQIKYKSE